MNKISNKSKNYKRNIFLIISYLNIQTIVYICIPLFNGKLQVYLLKAGVVELVDTLDLGSSAAFNELAFFV